MIARHATGAETWLLSLPPTRRQTRWMIVVGVRHAAVLALLAVRSGHDLSADSTGRGPEGCCCRASASPLAEFSTTTSLICTIGVTSVKLRMSPRISWACGPNEDWYSSTESQIRWHMATNAAGASAV